MCVYHDFKYIDFIIPLYKSAEIRSSGDIAIHVCKYRNVYFTKNFFVRVYVSEDATYANYAILFFFFSVHCSRNHLSTL